MEVYRPEYWSGYPFPSPGDLPNPGIEPRSPILQADSLPAELSGKPGPMESAYLLFLRNWTWIFHGGPTVSYESLRSGADLIPSLLTTLTLRGLCRPAPAGTLRWGVPARPVCFRDSRSHRASLRCVSAMRPSSSVQQACCYFSVWILLFPTELLRHVYTFKMGVLCLVCGLQIFPLSLCLAFIPILFKETFAEHFCIFFKFRFH